MFDKKQFSDLHTFDGNFTGFVGAEREWYVCDRNGVPVPRAPEILSRLGLGPRWTYELSACQIEGRTAPTVSAVELARELAGLQYDANRIARPMGLEIVSMEVAPESISREVYPDDRYKTISSTLPEDRFVAALRVAGTHIHVGCANMDEAIRVHDALVEHLDELIALGNYSRGERIRLYECVTAPHTYPRPYGSFDRYYDDAVRCGFTDDLRRNWHLIRISRYGTVEVRAFGSPPGNTVVGEWAAHIQNIRRQAIR